MDQMQLDVFEVLQNKLKYWQGSQPKPLSLSGAVEHHQGFTYKVIVNFVLVLNQKPPFLLNSTMNQSNPILQKRCCSEFYCVTTTQNLPKPNLLNSLSVKTLR